MNTIRSRLKKLNDNLLFMKILDFIYGSINFPFKLYFNENDSWFKKDITHIRQS